MKPRGLLLAAAVAGVVALLGWAGVVLTSAVAVTDTPSVPTTRVKRGDVTFTVTARGELQGGNSQMLTAPMTGGREMTITYLRKPGELVEKGDLVAQFDTTEETFKLREAEADLAEAEQQVAQAKAEAAAKEEEDRHELIQTRAELRLAELEVRRNPLLPALVARQNDLVLAAVRERLAQLERDIADRRATSDAAIAIQEAARSKAKVQAETARKNIELMTLRAPSGGYVSVQRNMNTNWYYTGMQFPLFQVGDMARPGMAVAQIPDLSNWEVTARLGELDRGHLGVGQAALIRIIALPGRSFRGKIIDLGGTTGPPWDRRFECKLSLEDPAAELRPGMSARIVITTETLKEALWIPAQALFESDGRTFVYRRSEKGFVPADVKLVRRGESQVVIAGLQEGEQVALASPVQQKEGKSGGGNALQAIPK